MNLLAPKISYLYKKITSFFFNSNALFIPLARIFSVACSLIKRIIWQSQQSKRRIENSVVQVNVIEESELKFLYLTINFDAKN